MRDERLFLDDIVLHARRIVEKTRGLSFEQFAANDDKVLAVTYLLQIIGEAASCVSDAGRAAFPSVPWRQIVGMRNLIVHEYFRVDVQRVWETSTVHVPFLLTVVGLSIEPPPESEL